MSIILAFILTLLSFVFNKSKPLAIFILAFMWVLFGWNYYNGDYEAYEKMYNEMIFIIVVDKTEILFKLLCVGGNLIGLSFQQFQIIIALLIILLWARFIFKYSNNPALFSIIFLWFFFPLDFVLLRNFFAFAVVLQGVSLLLSNGKNKYYWFVLYVALGTCIHTTSIIYLCFLLIPAYTKWKFKYYHVVIASILGLIVYKLFIQNFFAVAMDETGERGIYQTNFFTFMFQSLVQFSFTLFLIYVLKTNRKYILNPNKRLFYYMLVNVNIIIFILIIFYFDYSIFIRLYRNLAIINVLALIDLLIYRNNTAVNKLFLSIGLTCYLGFFFLYFIVPFWGYTMESLFSFNLLFN